MFEFHGWVNIQCTENDEEELYLTEIRQNQLCNDIQKRLKPFEGCSGIFKIFNGLNGEDHLIMSGFTNARKEYQQALIDLLYWIANLKSDSFGILHIIDHDKVCMKEIDGIKVWRLIKDEVCMLEDTIFSTEINRMLNIYE